MISYYQQGIELTHSTSIYISYSSVCLSFGPPHPGARTVGPMTLILACFLQLVISQQTVLIDSLPIFYWQLAERQSRKFYYCGKQKRMQQSNAHEWDPTGKFSLHYIFKWKALVMISSVSHHGFVYPGSRVHVYGIHTGP